MEKDNHWCKVCGTGYYACNDCRNTGEWKHSTCCPEHYQIYTALVFYNRHGATKEQTAAYLKSLKISEAEIATFTESTQAQLKDIMAVLEAPTKETETPKVSRKNKRARG